MVCTTFFPLNRGEKMLQYFCIPLLEVFRMKKVNLALICLLLAVPCSARTIIVDANGTGDYPTIQAAIDDANDGDEIVLQPGTYTGDGNRDIDFLGKAITVLSENGPSNCIIDCNGSSADPHRGFYFHSNEDYNSVLNGFTITNGYAEDGGGIYCSNSNFVIRNCILHDNQANGFGGGICYDNNSLGIIINCTITENSANTNGSGTYCSLDSNVAVTNSIVWGNDGNDIVADNPLITYSDTAQGLKGTGNIFAPPCFVNAKDKDYHLKSKGYRYDPNQGTWNSNEFTSFCIDAGKPGYLLPDELLSVPPDPNNDVSENLRINIGAYGGTSQASIAEKGWSLLADLNNDRMVNFKDLAILALDWMEQGQYLPGDLDRSGEVRGTDIKKLSDDWLVGEGTELVLNKPSMSSYYEPAADSGIEPNAAGYELPLDVNQVYNFNAVNSQITISDCTGLLQQNGFFILEDFELPTPPGTGGIPGDIREGFVTIYEQLRRMEFYLYVTVDTILHIYHIQFDETLKDIEEAEFIPDINALTVALLDIAKTDYNEYTGDLKEAAKRNVAYLSVANKLLDPYATVPSYVSAIVNSELSRIEAHAGMDYSDIFLYQEDYSQYVPRGHYTRSEALEKYFKAMMWYGRMSFILKGGTQQEVDDGEALVTHYNAKIQTLQAMHLAQSLGLAQVDTRTGKEVLDRMSSIIDFYVGTADDLTPYEYIEVSDSVFGSDLDLFDLQNEDNYFALKYHLSKLRPPEIYGGTGGEDLALWPPFYPEQLDELLDITKGMRFFGQRFIPDSYMFQELVFPSVIEPTGSFTPTPFTLGDTGGGLARCYPMGLDVMAILGSDTAKNILTEAGDTSYVNYDNQFNMLKDTFDAFDEYHWNKNLYWGWLYALKSLIGGFEDGYPNYMNTEAWDKKELNSALASWTELRHDTILYAKQSYTPFGRGGIEPPPDATGYVEPLVEFYYRMEDLTELTQQGLSDMNALPPDANERLVAFSDMLSTLKDISERELQNQPLTSEDFDFIGNIAQTLEEAITGSDDDGVSTILVADVHTHSNEEMVVEEGVGYIDLIFVATEYPNGSIVLSIGPVFSYYEFKWPMDDRLTDEAWRTLLDSVDKPDRPPWFQPFLH